MRRQSATRVSSSERRQGRAGLFGVHGFFRDDRDIAGDSPGGFLPAGLLFPAHHADRLSLDLEEGAAAGRAALREHFSPFEEVSGHDIIFALHGSCSGQSRPEHPVSFHHTRSVVRYHDSSAWRGEREGKPREGADTLKNNVNPGSFYQKTSRRMIITKLYKRDILNNKRRMESPLCQVPRKQSRTVS